MSGFSSNASVAREEAMNHFSRLSATSGIVRSHVLSSLLSYLLIETLEGRGSCLSQKVIGAELLKIGPDFDPNIDPIVRVHVGRLRRVLNEFYQGPGAGEPIRFSIPPGSYALRVERVVRAGGTRCGSLLPRVALLEFRGIGLSTPWDLFPIVLSAELSVGAASSCSVIRSSSMCSEDGCVSMWKVRGSGGIAQVEAAGVLGGGDEGQLEPGLNRLEGIIHQPHGELAIVTSQPRFEIIPVSVPEIDDRPEDNLGVFNAHDKNLVRAGEDLIPFDVIPCHPAGGFLAFIEETLSASHSLRAVRSVATARS
jgi:hypothetical protein